MGIVTDATPVNEPKNTMRSVLFQIYSLFLNVSDLKELKHRFESPGLRYSDVKKELVDVIWEYFSDYRERRYDLLNDKS